ncbi:MAG: hypothetical protein M3441_01080 [Chloroflexota bacterium]|nr:hypothetical protein [Chloroflexota bacterium]
MSETNIAKAIATYASSSTCKYAMRTVTHEPLRTFCNALDRLKMHMRDAAQDDYWQTYLGGLSLYRYIATTTPLPLNHLLLYGEWPAELLRRSIAYCQSVFPRLAADANALLDQYEQLGSLDDNPLLDAIVEALSEYGSGERVGIVLARGRYAEEVETLLKRRLADSTGSAEEEPVDTLLGSALQTYLDESARPRQVEVITPAQLRSTETYSRLVMPGVVYYYPDYVFSAPRAHRITVLQYDWIRSGWRYASPFEGGIPRLNGRRMVEPPSSPAQSPEQDQDEAPTGAEVSSAPTSADSIVDDGFGYDGREVTETFDRLTSRLDETAGGRLPTFHPDPDEGGRRAGVAGHGDRQESVRALLFLLEDGLGVYLEVGTEGESTVVDVEQSGTPKVDTVLTAEIEPGMYVLLRTEGGGDFVQAVADGVLADSAARLRAVQRQWKSRLREEVNRFGMQYAASSLRRMGAQRASEPNIRNWMSQRNIRTRDYADFAAVMRFIGMGSQTQSIWDDMDAIYQAHRDAGWEIRRMLDAEVRRADLRRLRTTGRMDFRLPGAVGGSLSLIRIEQVAKKPVSVPVSRLGHLFEMPAHQYAMHLLADNRRG